MRAEGRNASRISTEFAGIADGALCRASGAPVARKTLLGLPSFVWAFRSRWTLDAVAASERVVSAATF